MMKQWIVGCILFMFSVGLLAAPTILTVDDKHQLPFWPSQGKLVGGLLLVQGKSSRGIPLLTTLASDMSTRGWSVAVVPSYLPTKEFPQRLSDLLAKLRQETKLKIGVVWYGDDYHQVLDYFLKPQAKQISGLILLSAYQYPLDTAQESWHLRFPVLDVVAQFDYGTVIRDRTFRQKLFTKKNYAQRIIPGAKHDYHYQVNYLGAVIDGWLTKIPAPKVGRVF